MRGWQGLGENRSALGPYFQWEDTPEERGDGLRNVEHNPIPAETGSEVSLSFLSRMKWLSCTEPTVGQTEMVQNLKSLTTYREVK